MGLDLVVRWPLALLRARRRSRRAGEPPLDAGDDDDDGARLAPPSPAAAALLLAALVGSLARPARPALVFMSWTLPLMPLADLARSSPPLARLVPHGPWDNRTALAEPVRWPWLPPGPPLPGFADWYQPGAVHYRAAADPLRPADLDRPLLPALRGRLARLRFRHVMLITLEATRKDVFPLKKHGAVWKRLVASFRARHKPFPRAARQRLASLTPTASLLTGDYDDGFGPRRPRRPLRGAINANNAHTTSTYTLKSLTGSQCGLSPLVADFNLEPNHHLYQPCLPHIFDAFNRLGHADHPPAHDFTAFNWTSAFVQSVTSNFDRQDQLLARFGYPRGNVVSLEHLRSSAARFGRVSRPNLNYFGLPEAATQEYIRDVFASANRNNQRVFLTHLTSTTHHPFDIPASGDYVPLADGLSDLSHYANAVGYVDRWLAKILDILDAEGVANETLLVLVGDHGMSIAEQGSVTTYANGHVANFHVPLVFSHPQLPQIDIDDAVTSSQILPTILDLLAESDSLSPAIRQAATDLARNYEGQSLLRPLNTTQARAGSRDWQHSLINPGGQMVAVRDSSTPGRRLVVPIIQDIAWRFTDVSSDPHEEHPILSFDYFSLLRAVEHKHGTEAANWVQDAAYVTRWWAADNAKRWRYNYGPLAP